MNILFLTMGRFESIEAHSIYADLLRCFRNNGHEIYAITPIEKKTGKKTELVHENGAHVLHLEAGDVKEASNLIKKGLAQLSIEPTYIKGIKRYFSDVKFDLVMYSTPPITFGKAVKYVKKRDGAKTYLLLKDIFPQNAVDLGMMAVNGLKGLIYKYFRRKEKMLYSISDRIGCMSEANVQYVIEHNPEVDPKKVEVCPNSVEVIDRSIDNATRTAIRNKYHIPLNKTVFVYGGNLGKPQGIPFLIKCLRESKNIENAFFLIVGSGTEFHLLQDFIDQDNPSNVKLMKSLPKEDYDTAVAACDVGMIFLDYRFTIPNYPSRLLSYMQSSIPVLLCVDNNTDIGRIAEENGYGISSSSNNVRDFLNGVSRMCESNLIDMGKRARKYLEENYTVEEAYKIIMKE